MASGLHGLHGSCKYHQYLQATLACLERILWCEASQLSGDRITEGPVYVSMNLNCVKEKRASEFK
jgi:hypothetical protein